MSDGKSAAGLIRSEIEEKRLRVQKLRERRQQQQQADAAKASPQTKIRPETPTGAASSAASASSSAVNGSSPMDALLASIPGLVGGKPAAAVSCPIPPTSPSLTPEPTNPPPPSPAVSPQPQIAPTPTRLARARPKLSIALEEAVADVLPREVLTYSKSTQTAADEGTMSPAPQRSNRGAGASPTASPLLGAMRVPLSRRPPHDALLAQELSLDPSAPHKSTDAAAESTGIALAEPGAAAAAEMSPEEAAAVMASGQFTAFLGHAARMVERAAALNDKFPDIAADYLGLREGGASSVGLASGSAIARPGLAQQCVFSDPELSQGRTVTCLAWSPHHEELLLAGFAEKSAVVDGVSADGDGLVAVWSVPSALGRAEQYLTCQSAVMSAVFSPAQAQCVVGGTRAGQIVLWDLRAGHSPVLSRPPSVRTHTSPIYCLAAVADYTGAAFGSDDGSGEGAAVSGGYTLASLSSDGRLCTWSLRNLAQPMESVNIQLNARANEITAMAMPPYSSRSFVVGTEDGTVLTYNAHNNKLFGTIERAEGLTQHSGPVLGLDFHAASAASSARAAAHDSLSRLFLSCSADWTIRIWAAQRQQQSPARAVHAFPEAGDCVFDVRWSPVHPAAFASADGQGKLSMYDITQSLEAPVDSCSCGQPLTTMRWNRQGNVIAAGDAVGAIHVVSVGERWATAKQEDWTAVSDITRKLVSSATPLPMASSSFTSLPAPV